MAKVSRNWIYKLIFLVLFPLKSYGYPSGAPEAVCQSLEPHHSGSTKQTSRAPYTVSADVRKGQNGDIVMVTIKGNEFKGYMLQARDPNNNAILNGTFEAPNGGKILNCHGNADTITHTGREFKYNLQATWKPPALYSGDVVFRSTVLKDYKTFWMDVESSRTAVKGGNSQQDKNPTTMAYSECGTVRSCFGLPSGCIERGTCQVLVMYLAGPAGVDFELVGAVTSDVWVAVGLSEDDKMGSDSVTECVNSNGIVRVQHSWNQGKQNQPLSQGLEGIRDATGEFSDGVILCRWKRDYVTNVRDTTFDIKKNNYHLLLAKGPPGSYAGKGIHNAISVSQSQVNLTSISVSGGIGVNYLVKIHGCFMVIAWIGFVSCAIILARYYKDSWENRTLCNVKIWFALHRALVLTSLAMIIAAFICILVYKDGVFDASNHAIVGLVSFILSLLQVLVAFFRPDHDDPKRPIFNWFHYVVGNSAHILAIVAIYFSVDLTTSGLPSSFTWVLTAFVVSFILTHLVNQIHSFQIAKKKSNEIKMAEMGGRIGQRNTTTDSKQTAETFKRLLIVSFASLAAIFVLAMVILIAKAE